MMTRATNRSPVPAASRSHVGSSIFPPPSGTVGRRLAQLASPGPIEVGAGAAGSRADVRSTKHDRGYRGLRSTIFPTRPLVAAADLGSCSRQRNPASRRTSPSTPSADTLYVIGDGG